MQYVSNDLKEDRTGRLLSRRAVPYYIEKMPVMGM